MCRGRATAVMLFKSTAVHIPLLGQCCFFNVSASCLWGFLLNLTDQTLLFLPSPFFSLASPHTVSLTDFFCEELLLIFSEVISLRFLHKCIGEWEGREGNMQVENCLGTASAWQSVSPLVFRISLNLWNLKSLFGWLT